MGISDLIDPLASSLKALSSILNYFYTIIWYDNNNVMA